MMADYCDGELPALQNTWNVNASSSSYQDSVGDSELYSKLCNYRHICKISASKVAALGDVLKAFHGPSEKRNDEKVCLEPQLAARCSNSELQRDADSLLVFPFLQHRLPSKKVSKRLKMKNEKYHG